jgi:hypothetical protein
VRVAGPAEQAAAVNDVALGGHAVALLHVGHEAADFDDFTSELVTDDEGRLASSLRSVVPVVDVDVGAAHAGAMHADENFVVANARLWYVAHHEAGTGSFLHQSFHSYSANIVARESSIIDARR